MTRMLKISINSILTIFLSITILFVTVGSAQNNPLEFYKLNISNQADYWDELFISSWYSGEYGISFPQQNYSYDHYNYFDYGFPDTTFVNPWLWGWVDSFTKSGSSNYTNSISTFLNRPSYVQSLYSGVPLGCSLIFEKKTCVSRGACHIPLYCPGYVSNYFYY
ncbi:MAG: hypothetical protein ACMUIU_15965 [bacterium]